MKSVTISGSRRENVGKRDAKELRYQGRVPAVLYGGQQEMHFSVSTADLKGLVYTVDVQFVDLDIEGVKARTIIQDLQFHPLTDLPLHVDFLELNEKKPVTMSIPIKLTGTSPGVRTGGKLIQKLRKLRVKALPKDMPQYVDISLESLDLGKSVAVGQLKVDHFTIMNDPEDTIVSVIVSRALKQSEQEPEKK